MKLNDYDDDDGYMINQIWLLMWCLLIKWLLSNRCRSSYGSFIELDAKILTKRLKVRTHDSNALFAKLCYPTNSTKKPCISLRVFYLSLLSGNSSWVHSSTQGLSHHIAGEIFSPLKMVANRRWARWFYLVFSSTCFCRRMSLMLAMYLKLMLL